MLEPAATWFDNATSSWSEDDADDIARLRGTTSVSVVVPARNEAATIGDVVSRIHALVDAGLVDELVVIDSDSTDDTARLAAEAGAVVHAAKAVRPDLGTHRGKGEALWKSQFVTTGDLLVFIDADLTRWDVHFVTGLLMPLVRRPEVMLVKGFYDRLLDDGTGSAGAHAPAGGRVTELVARPLLDLHWPQLAAVVQPLAGEWAIRRAAFEATPVPVGYGVELAVLLDVFAVHGLDAIAQVDLGERAHSHQSVHDLGVMAAELLALAARRLGLSTSADQLWQYRRDAAPPWRPRAVPLVERPPLRERTGDAAVG